MKAAHTADRKSKRSRCFELEATKRLTYDAASVGTRKAEAANLSAVRESGCRAKWLQRDVNFSWRECGPLPTVTYYDILGVSRTASPAEIKSAFRRLVKKYHPDLTPGVEGVRFRKIVEAFRTVSDPRKRKAYDRRIRKAEEESRPDVGPVL